MSSRQWQARAARWAHLSLKEWDELGPAYQAETLAFYQTETEMEGWERDHPAPSPKAAMKK